MVTVVAAATIGAAGVLLLPPHAMTNKDTRPAAAASLKPVFAFIHNPLKIWLGQFGTFYEKHLFSTSDNRA
jgi:hypothetical protein